jgi:hypothetical protein
VILYAPFGRAQKYPLRRRDYLSRSFFEEILRMSFFGEFC